MAVAAPLFIPSECIRARAPAPDTQPANLGALSDGIQGNLGEGGGAVANEDCDTVLAPHTNNSVHPPPLKFCALSTYPISTPYLGWASYYLMEVIIACVGGDKLPKRRFPTQPSRESEPSSLSSSPHLPPDFSRGYLSAFRFHKWAHRILD